jgi:hypothetical protein
MKKKKKKGKRGERDRPKRNIIKKMQLWSYTIYKSEINLF